MGERLENLPVTDTITGVSTATHETHEQHDAERHGLAQGEGACSSQSPPPSRRPSRVRAVEMLFGVLPWRVRRGVLSSCVEPIAATCTEDAERTDEFDCQQGKTHGTALRVSPHLPGVGKIRCPAAIKKLLVRVDE